MCQLRAPAAGLGPATHKAQPCREVCLAETAQRRSSMSRISSVEGLGPRTVDGSEGFIAMVSYPGGREALERNPWTEMAQSGCGFGAA